VRLVSGFTHRTKALDVAGADPQRLEALLEGE
jgi:hypothetical protein